MLYLHEHHFRHTHTRTRARKTINASVRAARHTMALVLALARVALRFDKTLILFDLPQSEFRFPLSPCACVCVCMYTHARAPFHHHRPSSAALSAPSLCAIHACAWDCLCSNRVFSLPSSKYSTIRWCACVCCGVGDYVSDWRVFEK